MKKIVIYILVLTALLSCSEKTSKPKISKELIDLISSETSKEKKAFDSKKKIYVSHYNDVKVFGKLNNGKFIKTRFYEFLELYEKKFTTKFDSFDGFMNEVINEDLVLNESDFIETATFQLDKDLNKEFESLPFEEFLEKYSLRKKNDKKLYLNYSFSSASKYLTLSYLLYTKGYYIGEDCLNGFSGIYKFENLLRK